ncbi:hypothetical protein C2R46_06990 [Helicobacter pylori]|nr:hypothetical protein C2R46_06990 [Helicobacter pylori]
MFSPFWIKLDFNIRDFIHWNAFALECICIGMYLEYYSIKRFFFFCHLGKILSFFYFWRFLFGVSLIKRLLAFFKIK